MIVTVTGGGVVIPGGGSTPTTNVSFGSKAVSSSVIGRKLHAIVSEAGIVMSTEDGVKSIPPIEKMFKHWSRNLFDWREGLVSLSH